jgi:hypothetical protein
VTRPPTPNPNQHFVLFDLDAYGRIPIVHFFQWAMRKVRVRPNPNPSVAFLSFLLIYLLFRESAVRVAAAARAQRAASLVAFK